MDSKERIMKCEELLEDYAFKVGQNLFVPGRNLVYSSFSLSLALGILLEATDGEYRNEIVASVLDSKQGDRDPEYTSECMMRLLSGHSNGVQSLLSVADLFYAHKDLKLKEDFLTNIHDKYGAIGRQLDFVHKNSEALKSINNDINTETKGMIPKMLDSITTDTKAIIVSAIHFKGLWLNRFESRDTVFHLSNGQTVKVPMMKGKGKYAIGHSRKHHYRTLKLPYLSTSEGEKAHMIIVLPHGNVQEFLSTFDVEDFNDCTKKDDSWSSVNVKLPRFKIESTHDLVGTLKTMGIKKIFENNAKLSKVSETPLEVSKIVQKAVIEVNENGTEASAATGIKIAYHARRATFHADRPFVYVITSQNQDNTRNILFVGVVENPIEK